MGEHWRSYELLIPKESFAMRFPATIYPGLSHGELKGSLITSGTFQIGWHHVSVCLLSYKTYFVTVI